MGCGKGCTLPASRPYLSGPTAQAASRQGGVGIPRHSTLFLSTPSGPPRNLPGASLPGPFKTFLGTALGSQSPFGGCTPLMTFGSRCLEALIPGDSRIPCPNPDTGALENPLKRGMEVHVYFFIQQHLSSP